MKRANPPADSRSPRSDIAAKQLDRTVARIIRNLRQGEPAHLPGVGTLLPGKPWKFSPDKTGKSR